MFKQQKLYLYNFLYDDGMTFPSSIFSLFLRLHLKLSMVMVNANIKCLNTLLLLYIFTAAGILHTFLKLSF